MPADALMTLGARASAGMYCIDSQSRNIPSPASRELIFHINQQRQKIQIHFEKITQLFKAANKYVIIVESNILLVAYH